MLLKMLHDTKSHSLAGFLASDFSRVSPPTSPRRSARTAQAFAGRAAAKRPRRGRRGALQGDPGHQDHGAADELHLAHRREGDPPRPLQADQGRVLHRGDPAAGGVPRQSLRHRGGLAFGKGPGPAASRRRPGVPLAEGEQQEDDNELARVIRYANRVPLLYQQSACATFKAGARHRLAELRRVPVPRRAAGRAHGDLRPHGLGLGAVHQRVQGSDRRLRRDPQGDQARAAGVRAAARRVPQRRERAKSEFRRRNIFELYIEEVVEACNRLKGGKLPKEKLKDQLQKIAMKRTGGRDRRDPGPRRRRPGGPARTRSSSRAEGPKARRRCCRRRDEARTAQRGRSNGRRRIAGPGGPGKAGRAEDKRSRGDEGQGPAKVNRAENAEANETWAKRRAQARRKAGQEKTWREKAKRTERSRRSSSAWPTSSSPPPQRSKDPTLAIPVRSLANVNFNEKRGIIEMGKRKQARTFFNVGMAKKFMQTVLVADALAELQRANLTTSLREIYYRTKHTMKDSHENTFDGQNESDPLIEDLEVTLAALREELHVRAENAGSVVGPLVLVDDGDRVDCARLGKGGYSVPSIVEPEYIEIRRCTADFVLLVEKGTQWNRLSEDKFWRRYNCVLLTGNGQPPRGVRRLARRLHEEYKLPVYVLVDNDPWGYYIYSVVKQGSINLAFESERMAIPKAKFIGLSSADPDRYGLPRNVGIKLNEPDLRYIFCDSFPNGH